MTGVRGTDTAADVARARAAVLGADVVVLRTDADGLASGAIAHRSRCERAEGVLLLDRGETPFAPGALLGRGAPAVLDRGVPPARPVGRARRPPRARVDAARRCRRRLGLRRIAGGLDGRPLVAESWRRRWRPRAVIAANDDMPGRVNFSVRGGDGDLRRLLRDALPDLGGEFAHGHDRATGGSLAHGDFDTLLEALGLTG